jgi:hypothetical protein
VQNGESGAGHPVVPGLHLVEKIRPFVRPTTVCLVHQARVESESVGLTSVPPGRRNVQL